MELFHADVFADCERWIVQLTVLSLLACEAADLIRSAFARFRRKTVDSKPDPDV